MGMPEYIHEYHTNGMKFIALDKDGKVMKEWLSILLVEEQ